MNGVDTCASTEPLARHTSVHVQFEFEEEEKTSQLHCYSCLGIPTVQVSTVNLRSPFSILNEEFADGWQVF